MIVGVSGYDTLAGDILTRELYTLRTRTYDSITTHTWTWGARSSLTIDANDIGLLMASDTFALDLQVFDPFNIILNNSQRPYRGTGGYQDFLEFNGAILSVRGGEVPYAFTSRQTFRGTGNEGARKTWPDTTGYERRIVGMGLEAPGQLRSIPLAFAAESALTGTYQWVYGFGANDTIDDDTLFSETGPISNPVKLDNQYVYLTGFLQRPYRLQDTVTDADAVRDPTLSASGVPPTEIRLLRRRTDGDNAWKFVDTFWVHPDSSVAYIDSGQNGTSIDTQAIATNIPPPGSIIAFGFTTASLFQWDTLPGWIASIDTNYWFRYSWYDPILDIESPFGPKWQSIAVDSNGTGLEVRMVIADLGIPTTRTQSGETASDSVALSKWIRLYRTVNIGSVLGAGDTLVWYCVGQYRIDRSIGPAIEIGSAERFYEASIFMGLYSDTMLGSGGVPTDSQLFKFSYADENLVFDRDGTTIIRPPFLFGNQVYYSDIEYANGRLWGIGDELFPQRLYYSAFDRMDNWSPLEYISISEDDNDELVAIEALSAGDLDILYAFKHNSIYQILGEDVEFDAFLSTVTRSNGALDRFSIIKYQNAVYWLSPNMKIYKISNRELREISQPIENYIDSIFTSYTAARDSVRTYVLTDKIGWGHIGSKEALVFHVPSQTWAIEAYTSNFIPYGSFTYDTTQNRSGFGNNTQIVFRSDTAMPFVFEIDTTVDTSLDAGDSMSVFDWNYQTPFIGGEDNIWQIPYVNFTATAQDSTYMVLTVFNEDGDSLVVDSILITTVAETTYRVGLPRHSGEFLSVRFEDNGAIKLSSVSVARKRVGRARIK